jgi:hypothetical protein
MIDSRDFFEKIIDILKKQKLISLPSVRPSGTRQRIYFKKINFFAECQTRRHSEKN